MKKILFLCTGNACRSQIAEGLLRHLAGARFQVFSAGTYPSRVHPCSIKVMQEWGLDISSHTSDHVDDYLEEGIDIVISVCDSARQICPTFPGEVKRLHWSIEDPFGSWNTAHENLDNYRQTRNILKEKIDEFMVSEKKSSAATL